MKSMAKKVLIIKAANDRLTGLTAYLKEKRPDLQISTKVLSCGFLKKRFYGKGKILLSFVLGVLRLLRQSNVLKEKYDYYVISEMTVVLPFLFVSRCFHVFKPNANIIVIHFFIHKFGENRMVRLALRFLLNNKHIVLNAQCRHETAVFEKISQTVEIRYFPYCQGRLQIADNAGAGERYIFSGGYTNRDYDCLLRAAKKVNYKFLIICSGLNRFKVNIPDNVRIIKDEKKEYFYGYLKNASIVVLPLKHETGASGQMVALGSMYLKKPVIYSNVDSVGQYFTDNWSGLSYAKGSDEELARKLNRLLANPQQRLLLAENAYKKYTESYLDIYFHQFISQCLK
jgi:glycosyltransferase involved in cell wall biosynthesis